MKHRVGSAFIVGICASSAFSGTIHVPTDSPTIQIAISQAQPFDTIIVAPGTYFEAISFGGKVITVQSSNPTNPATVAGTIINAGGLGSVVTFNGGEDQINTILDGFTITGGTVGINGNDSRAVVRRCIIKNNSSIGIQKCDGMIEDTQVLSNNSSGISDCDGTITRCLISDNNGAGIGACDGAITDSTIELTRNGPGIGGGAIDVLRCIIRANSAEGILSSNQFSSFTGDISESFVIGNKSHGINGAGWVDTGLFRNSVVAGNRGNGFHHSKKDVQNCTIASNRDYGFLNHTGIIRHCIIWDNPLGALIASSTPTFSGTFNPYFLIPGAWDAINMVWLDGDYHLTPNSPYIDVGDPFFLMDPLAPLIDITGSPRVVGARIDIGAFEFQADCVGEDFDSDGTADICDPDIDGDGITNVTDVCDDTPSGLTVDFEGRPTADLNHDCSVDLVDYALFQNDLIGP